MFEQQLLKHFLPNSASWPQGKMQYKQVEVYALPDLIPSELVTFRTSDLCAMLWGSVKRLGLSRCFFSLFATDRWP